MGEKICAVAIAASTFSIDKLYDYTLPSALVQKANIGCRVLVPFGRGNRHIEGIILAFREKSEFEKLKPIDDVLDITPVLDSEQIKLAIWMRERLACTFYDCIHAMLPVGLWFRRNDTYTLIADQDAVDKLKETEYASILSCFSDEKSLTLEQIRTIKGNQSILIKLDALCKQGILRYDSKVTQKIGDKTTKMYRLICDYAEAMEKEGRSKRNSVRLDVISCLADGEQMSKQELKYMTGVSDAILKGMVKRGILECTEKEKFRAPDYQDVEILPQNQLSKAQQDIYQDIKALYENEKNQTALLYGVTGSGKTQIYLHLIENVLKNNQSVIVLVPEIALTPQFIKVFTARFGKEVTVLHSALGVGERYDSWKKIKMGLCRVVIGTRSAVFAPVKSLGLIIIDEEQDSAYQSEQSPRYHARDIALYRTMQSNSLLLLGSATPSVESFYRAEQGVYKLFELNERYGNSSLPDVIIADMRGLSREGIMGSISPILKKHIEQNLNNKEQTILFLNRRGSNRVIGCSMCGWVPECPSCSTTMTYHSVNSRAMCHYCGASIKIQNTCPECGSSHLFFETAGTQHVEGELKQLFPQAKVIRMDADTTSTKNSHEVLLDSFANGKADILIGTQMVTKGLDFENVTLVGVLEADQSLYAQDYTAEERTFSLITQVIGRAGRRNTKGRAIIQTFSPNHPVLLNAARQDYTAFYKNEIEKRMALRCPPVAQLLFICASGENERNVIESLMRLKSRLNGLMQGQFSDFSYPVLGPAAASMVKISGKYRYHLTIRCPENKRRKQLVNGVLCEFAGDKLNKGVSLHIELNPTCI